MLWGDDGKPLAVVEAKRTKKSPKVGEQQAKLYADCLEQMTGQRPLIFYSNGFETWLWDDSTYLPRPVQGFYTKDQLQLAINRRSSRKSINNAPVNKAIVNRYYQEEALRRVLEYYGVDMASKSLAVMATGSGKTRTAVALVEIMQKANWVRNVLFLADRNALVRQAKGAFNSHLPHATLINLVEEKEDDSSRIVFSTYPTMMNCIDDTSRDGQKRFSVGHFDLIIIDEAHRSVYQKYGAIFDYFDALIIGLTATPKADVGKNTYRLFDLENNVPTYAYELDQAVADEFLVPPRAISVPLKFQREGVKYAELSDDDKEEYEATFSDEEHFVLFDYCQNFEFFGENPDGFEAKLQESVKQKIFKRRLDIAISLQEGETDQELRQEILGQMHATVKGMDTENFIVRAQRRHVEMFNDRQRWDELNVGDVIEIREHLTQLPSLDDDDEFARRFDLLILNLQLAIIGEQAIQMIYREQVRELASALEEKKAVPSVAKELELILELQTDEYWEGATLPMLESVRCKLRDLVKFIDRQKKQQTVYTDMEDEIGDGTHLDNFIVGDPSLKNYRLKVEKYVRKNQNHITIRRLKNNEPISGHDLKALEDILFAENVISIVQACESERGGRLICEVLI